ncbi:MAG: PD40 domain-containing protein, partial [Paraglaciecola sp.]|nr:PD40 domain-containing protein [Paraglaciecola sp.]
MSLCVCLLGCADEQILTVEQDPDPVLVDVPIAFIKRPAPLNEDSVLVSKDLRILNDFLPGATLLIKARASVSALETNISDRAFFTEQQILAASQTSPLAGYDVKDLSVSYDGTRLLFVMRAPEIEDADDDEQPSWNIWQYDLTQDSLIRVIPSDLDAEFGQDTSPAYLPDGRIVFSSTRQQANQALLLDEGKPQYQALDENRDEIASVLHVMDSDGNNIQQISFNQSHDLDPMVLSSGNSSGKILFSRWDNAANNNSINIYQMNADGSALEIVYGRHSHNSELTEQALQFTQLTEQPNGLLLAAIRPFVSNNWGGEYVNIDIANFIDNNMPVASQSGSNGQAQEPALFDNILIDGNISPGGRFSAVYPLWDGSQRVLFSWSQCRVYDPAQVLAQGDVRVILPCDDELLANPLTQSAPLIFGLWMYDPIENTQLIINVPEEGI